MGGRSFMAKNADDKLFDSRTVEKNINKGLVTRKDYEKYLDSLADESKNCEEITLEDESDD